MRADRRRHAGLLLLAGLALSAAIAGLSWRHEQALHVVDERLAVPASSKVQPQGNGSCPTDRDGDRWVVVCNEHTQFSAVCLVDARVGGPVVYLSTNPVRAVPLPPVAVVLESLQQWRGVGPDDVYRRVAAATVDLSERSANASSSAGYVAEWSLDRRQTSAQGSCLFTAQLFASSSSDEGVGESAAQLTAEFLVDRRPDAVPAATMIVSLTNYAFSDSDEPEPSNASSKLMLTFRVRGVDDLRWTNASQLELLSGDGRAAVTAPSARSADDDVPVTMLAWYQQYHVVGLLVDQWTPYSHVNQVEIAAVILVSPSACLSAVSLPVLLLALLCLLI